MRSFIPRPLFPCLIVVLLGSSLHADEGWGTITGKFVLKGERPKLEPLNLGDDPECCKAKPENERLVVGEQGELANVVVFLRPPRRGSVDVHPDYAQHATDEVALDNQGCAFTPHIALLRTGQTLVLENSDATNHNVKGKLGSEAFNFMVPAKRKQSITLHEAQRLPREVACSIHPFMRGWLLVRDDPYMAVSDTSGKFTIAKLPAGKHEFQFWHELPGYLKEISTDVGKLDRRGRIEITVPAGGKVDLGKIEVDVQELQGK